MGRTGAGWKMLGLEQSLGSRIVTCAAKPSGLATATRENARGALTYRDHEKVAQGLLSVHSFVRSGNHSFAPTWRSVRRRAQTPSRSAAAPAVPQTLTSPGRTLTVASTAARLRPVGGEADLDRLFAAAPSGSYATPRHRLQFRFPWCSLQRTGSASGKSIK
jgi:hypothetical protein